MSSSTRHHKCGMHRLIIISSKVKWLVNLIYLLNHSTSGKGANSLSIHLRDLKSICDQLHAIGKPIFNTNSVFQTSRGPGW